MATGTLASRGTGFIRTVVIAYALGIGSVNNAYTVANTVPNALYDLLLGGVLSALVVPLLVQAAHNDDDDGEAFAQRLMTIVAVVLTITAIIAVLIAPWIISTYAHNARPAQKALAEEPGLTVEVFETSGGLIRHNVVYWGLEEVASRFVVRG